MPISVQAPDGSIAQFPDGMADGDIEAVMRREYAPETAPPKQTTQAPSFWSRVAHGLADPFIGMAQNATNIGGINPLIDSLAAQEPEKYGMQQQAAANMVNKTITEREKEYADQRNSAGQAGMDWGRTLGNIASPANALYGAINTPKALATALLSGGTSGFNQPVPNVNSAEDFSKAKLVNTGLGSAGGILGYGAAKAGSTILNPIYSKAKQILLDAGIPLTTGQTIGGLAKTTEDALTSVPVLGDFIKNRQRDAFIGYNRAAIDRALMPIDDKLPPKLVGNEAVDYASEKLGDAYEKLLPKLNATVDQQLTDGVAQISQNASGKYLLPDDEEAQLNKIIKSQITDKSNNGFYDGDTLKNIQSAISKKARGYIKSGDTDKQSLGQALVDLHQTFNAFIARQNPNEAETLTNINEGWANFARVRQAAASATKEGIFTPAQLAQAVRGQAATQGQAATGHALMQDLSSAGKEILPSSVADSGTPLRHAFQLGTAMLAGHGAGIELPEWASGLGEAAGAGIGVGSALYSRPMQSVIRAMLTKRPDFARKIGSALIAQPAIPGAIGASAAFPMLQNGIAQ